MGFRTVGGHVRIPAKSALALFFGSLEHGRRVGVLEQNVSATVDQAGGRFSFLGWAEPFVHPHHLGGDLGVDRLGTQREGVDVANHLRNWHGTDDAQGVGLGHATRNDASHVSAFVGATVIGAHVVSRFVAGGVFEFDIFEIWRNLLDGVHVAKRCAKNHLVALAGQIAQHALGIGAFGHAFHIGSDDLVTHDFLQFLARRIVRKAPAAITHRADISKSNLQRLSLGRCLCNGCSSRCCSRFIFLTASSQSSHGQRRNSCQFEHGTFVQISHESSFWIGE